MVGGQMAHPADLVCSDCVRKAWDQPSDALHATLAATLQPRFGMSPESLATAIVRRMEDLHEMVKNRDDLETLLTRRGRISG